LASPGQILIDALKSGIPISTYEFFEK
jgi:hypothetical protein